MTMYTAFALIVIAAFGCASWLVVTGHPGFAVFILLITASISMTEKKKTP